MQHGSYFCNAAVVSGIVVATRPLFQELFLQSPNFCDMVVVSATTQPLFQELFLQSPNFYNIVVISATQSLFRELFSATRSLFQELFLQHNCCFCNWFVVSGINVSGKATRVREELDRTTRARRSDGCQGGGCLLNIHRQTRSSSLKELDRIPLKKIGYLPLFDVELT